MAHSTASATSSGVHRCSAIDCWARLEHLVGEPVARGELRRRRRRRPSELTMSSSTAGSKLRAKLVAMAPGMIVTTLMGSSSSSRRSDSLMQFTACLVAP